MQEPAGGADVRGLGRAYLLLLVGAEIQQDVEVLELPRRSLEDELLQRGHAQIHPGLKHGAQEVWHGNDSANRF